MKADGGENERRGIHGKVAGGGEDKASSTQRFRLPLFLKVYDPAGRKFQNTIINAPQRFMTVCHEKFVRYTFQNFGISNFITHDQIRRFPVSNVYIHNSHYSSFYE